ncbi:MAG: Membrane-bound lysozyme inhibitor of C-type lysozyme [Burkholderia gladioli]|nr:MAG: Membrane-bound lysozyme inhibitor of C-type lysozyme [Burkholderia gladioli]
MIRITFAAGVLAGATGLGLIPAAHAGQLTVEEIDTDARTVSTYRCANRPKPVRGAYWLARTGQSFALVPVDGKPMLFVDTVSASGARYQAGRYVWRTKGRTGSLRDEIGGQDAPPLADCTEIAPRGKPP